MKKTISAVIIAVLCAAAGYAIDNFVTDEYDLKELMTKQLTQ